MSYSRKRISDKFAGLKISRQRKWQLRRSLEGRCETCGKPSAWTGASRCLEHTIDAREHRHERGLVKKRYNSMSYRVQKVIG